MMLFQCPARNGRFHDEAVFLALPWIFCHVGWKPKNLNILAMAWPKAQTTFMAAVLWPLSMPKAWH